MPKYSGQISKLSSVLISSEKFISKQSDRQKLYNLNNVEFQVLKNLVIMVYFLLNLFLRKFKI